MRAFEGKVVLITGGGRGIGAACARVFAAAGARVVVASRTRAELEGVSAEVAAGGGQILAIPCDVADEAQVSALFEKAEKAFGPVDVLVNNAAIVRMGEVSDLSAKDWDDVLAVNLRGPFLCSREAFRQMKRAGRGGAIVNLSSLGGLRGTEKFKGFSAYSTSKFGMVGLTECLAVEGREHGIRVNCVAPGAVDTRMLQEAAPFLKTQTQPDDIAKIIYFLADGSQSASVSGTVVEVFSNA